MRKRWAKLVMPSLGVCLAASLTVSYAFAAVDEAVTSAAPASIEALLEPAPAPSVEQTPDAPQLSAPAEVLPGYVFVVGNREIVLERPSVVMYEPKGTSEDGSSRESGSGAGSVTARATVASSRMVVVDEDDQIIGIWSNTTGTKRGYYSLRVREGSSAGPEHSLTAEILDQYNRLLTSMDWTGCGRVY